MSIWGNPVMMGGSGGGGGGDKNAYASLSAPGAAVGQNGDYYFQLMNWFYALAVETTSNAQTNAGGWEFTVNDTISVIGARGKARSSYTATIKLGLSDGTVLRETSIELTAGEWVDVMFDSPVTLTAGQNCIIMLLGNSNTLYYSPREPSLTTSRLSYVRGRYGSFPGTQETGSYYNVDILYAVEPPYPLKKQYYKSSGVWVEVT